MVSMCDGEQEIQHRSLLGACRLVPILFEHPAPVRKRVPYGGVELRDDGLEEGPGRVGYGENLVAPERRRERGEGLTSVVGGRWPWGGVQACPGWRFGGVGLGGERRGEMGGRGSDMLGGEEANGTSGN